MRGQSRNASIFIRGTCPLLVAYATMFIMQPGVHAAPATYQPPYDDWDAWKYDKGAATAACPKTPGELDPGEDPEDYTKGYVACYADAYVGAGTAYSLQYAKNHYLDGPSRVHVHATIKYTGYALTQGPAAFGGAEAICFFDNQYERADVIPAFTGEILVQKVVEVISTATGSAAAEAVGNVLSLAAALQAAADNQDGDLTKTYHLRCSFPAEEGYHNIGVGVRVNAAGGLLGAAFALMIAKVEEIEVTAEPENAVYVLVKEAEDVPDEDPLPLAGESDPYVVVELQWGFDSKKEFETDANFNTEDPTWNEEFFYTIPFDSFRLRMKLYDEDFLIHEFDDYIGSRTRSYQVEDLLTPKDEEMDIGGATLYYSIWAKPKLLYPPRVVASFDRNYHPDEDITVAGSLELLTITGAQTVYFDGSQSSDEDDELFLFEWMLGGGWGTPGSRYRAWESEEGKWSCRAPSKPGIYPAGLWVMDRSGQYSVDSVLVIVEGEPPVADPGRDQVVGQGEVVRFDGSRSTDADDGIKEYRWQVGTGWAQPTDSGWLPWDDGQGVWTHEAPTALGEYVATLTVKDHFDFMDDDTVKITVVPADLLVDNLGDTDDGNAYSQGDETNTLRKCIRIANQASGRNVIRFSVSGTIATESALPWITDDATVIDAGPQWVGEWPSGQPGITIDGADAGSGGKPADGLVISGAGDCHIRGLLVKNFMIGIWLRNDAQNNTVGGIGAGHRNVISENGVGIQVGLLAAGSGANQNVIQGNYIGTDAQGTTAAGNSQDGIGITGDGNTVGGAIDEARNVISDNLSGITILGSNNTVLGNYIGTDATGSRAMGNAGAGVRISGLALGHSNTVGAKEGGGNVISANGTGVSIAGDSNTVCGNYIGTDASGTAALGNTEGGVSVQGDSNTIENNVVAANDVGIGITGDGNTISANLVGTDSGGTAALGNSDDGVWVRGSSNAVLDNIIAASGGHGVDLNLADDSTVSNNWIGTDRTGTRDLGNAEYGIHVAGGGSNIIGSPGNTVAFNPYGVVVSSSSGNRISRNAIHENWAIPDVAGGGISLADGNNGISPPSITAAALHEGTLFVKGAGAGSGATVEIFRADPAALAAGFAEGKAHLGDLTAGGQGAFRGFIAVDGTTLSPGDSLTATTTDTNDNTSEFTAPAVEVETLGGLILNGDFSYALLAWTTWEAGPWGGAMVGEAAASVVEDETTSSDVLEIERTGSQNTGAANGVSQELDLDLTGYLSLTLEAQVKIVHQSLEGGGNEGIEYPVHIVISYEDADGTGVGWHHGLYYNGTSNDPGISTKIDQDAWYAYTSPDLMALDPRPQAIKKITIFGNGWDYTGRIDNVRLTAETELQFVRGSVDDDGKITMADVIIVLRYLFLQEKPVIPCLDSADADDNGGIGLSDVIYLLLFLFAEGADPPQPYPGPGFDLTPDGLPCGP